MNIFSLLLKVFLSSLFLSVAIKYGGPSLDLEPTNLNVLLAVLLPPTAIAVLLGWKSLGGKGEL
ncbi:MAG: hypothetical protein ACRC6M_12935 [Microcystaceae cyanobacterium]